MHLIFTQMALYPTSVFLLVNELYVDLSKPFLGLGSIIFDNYIETMIEIIIQPLEINMTVTFYVL